MNVFTRAALAQLILITCLGLAWSQDAGNPTPADNTKVNKRDRHEASPTADQQSESTSDRDLAKKIRRTIVKDDSLSTYAHNIKVIVQNGTVTLKGPVRSDEEKQAILAKAVAIAGDGKIMDQLEVAPRETK
jgi:hyperosmotically inducible protein